VSRYRTHILNFIERIRTNCTLFYSILLPTALAIVEDQDPTKANSINANGLRILASLRTFFIITAPLWLEIPNPFS